MKHLGDSFASVFVVHIRRHIASRYAHDFPHDAVNQPLENRFYGAETHAPPL